MRGRDGLRGLACWLALTASASLAQAEEFGSSPEFTRLAECNRIAGKATGAKREALIAGCMERIEPAAGKAGKAAGAAARAQAEAKGEAAAKNAAAGAKSTAAKTVAPAAVAAGQAAPASALPSQTVILGCANQVAKLTGEARAKALKACLAGAQVESPPAANATAGPPADTEQRRRANCNVLAHDKQGEARKSFIADCMREAERRAVTRASAEAAPAGGDRAARCAAEARANPGVSVTAAMNACMARP